MRASKFTDAQRHSIIRQGEDGTPVEEIRQAWISQATYFNWKKKYSGMMPSEMKRLRELEDENNGGLFLQHVQSDILLHGVRSTVARRNLSASSARREQPPAITQCAER